MFLGTEITRLEKKNQYSTLEKLLTEFNKENCSPNSLLIRKCLQYYNCDSNTSNTSLKFMSRNTDNFKRDKHIGIVLLLLLL